MKSMTVLRDRLTDVASSLTDGANGVAGDLQTCAKDAWGSVRHQTNRAVHKSLARVQRNPLPAALATFGFGLALGLFLSRRYAVSFKER